MVEYLKLNLHNLATSNKRRRPPLWKEVAIVDYSKAKILLCLAFVNMFPQFKDKKNLIA